MRRGRPRHHRADELGERMKNGELLAEEAALLAGVSVQSARTWLRRSRLGDPEALKKPAPATKDLEPISTLTPAQRRALASRMRHVKLSNQCIGFVLGVASSTVAAYLKDSDRAELLNRAEGPR